MFLFSFFILKPRNNAQFFRSTFLIPWFLFLFLTRNHSFIWNVFTYFHSGNTKGILVFSPTLDTLIKPHVVFMLLIFYWSLKCWANICHFILIKQNYQPLPFFGQIVYEIKRYRSESYQQSYIIMEPDYHQKRSKIPPQKRQKWSNEQAHIRKQIIGFDKFDWNLDNVQLVGAVDVSFSGKFDNGACAGLVIYSMKSRKIIYEDYMYVILKEEYIPGFLAFRELPPTLELFRRLKATKPHLWPQVVLVDGNGILHKFQCGYACHLGVLLDIPTIGCAKTFFDVDGLHQNEVEDYLKDKLQNEGDSQIIKGKSGKQWCMAILADENNNSHLYVSIGHRISLETASKLTKKLTYRGSPTPIYFVDRNSRKMIKKFNETDYKSAKSYEMVYLLK